MRTPGPIMTRMIICRMDAMKTVYKIVDIVTNIITWSVILFILLSTSALFVPSFFEVKPYMVLSGSMEPAIHTGSLVYIGKIGDGIKEGDIIAYELDGGMPVVHRVIGKNESGYITKGDANDVPDMHPIPSSQILGKYRLTIPKAGYLLSGIKFHVLHIGSFTIPVIIPIVIGIMLLFNVLQYMIGLFINDHK